MSRRLRNHFTGWRDALWLTAGLLLLQGVLDPSHAAASTSRVVERTMQSRTIETTRRVGKTRKTIGQYNGPDVLAIRNKRGLNQQQFWSPLGVTQSGGSRYENGRHIPRPVRKLIWVMYESPLALAAKTNNVLAHADILLNKLEGI